MKTVIGTVDFDWFEKKENEYKVLMPIYSKDWDQYIHYEGFGNESFGQLISDVENLEEGKSVAELYEEWRKDNPENSSKVVAKKSLKDKLPFESVAPIKRVTTINGSVQAMRKRNFTFGNAILELPTGQLYLGNSDTLIEVMNESIKMIDISEKNIENIVDTYIAIDGYVEASSMIAEYEKENSNIDFTEQKERIENLTNLREIVKGK